MGSPGNRGTTSRERERDPIGRSRIGRKGGGGERRGAEGGGEGG